MKIKFYVKIGSCVLLFLVFCINGDTRAISLKRKVTKVLFVGNSLTYYNYMTETVQKMTDEVKLNFKIDQLTLPGYSLCSHARNIENNGFSRKAESNEVAIGVKKILSENWDDVILQERSGNTLISETRKFSFEPSLIFLDSLIKSIKGRTILYQNFSTEKYPYQFCIDKNEIEVFNQADNPSYVETKQNSFLMTNHYCSNNFANSTNEFLEIKLEFDKMAKKTNAGLVRVGYAFELMKKNHPEIQLYGEENHPSKQGSYLIACLFFKYLTGKNLQHVKYSADLVPKEAQLIRKFADTIH